MLMLAPLFRCTSAQLMRLDAYGVVIPCWPPCSHEDFTQTIGGVPTATSPMGCQCGWVHGSSPSWLFASAPTGNSSLPQRGAECRSATFNQPDDSGRFS